MDMNCAYCAEGKLVEAFANVMRRADNPVYEMKFPLRV